MGRAPCCDKANVKKGPWSPEEDAKLKSYIEQHGTGGNWIALPQKIGLKRCGKSCRLRWLNYLRPNIKHGGFSEEEDNIICSLYISIGSRWSIIAAQLPGRTDNDIKNYWNTRLKKKLLGKQRKEQQARRGSLQKQEMMMKKARERSTVNISDHNYTTVHNLNPYWPEALPVLPLIPYSNEEPRFNDHTSIRRLLIKLGGRFSDDHHEQPVDATNLDQFPTDANSSVQPPFEDSINLISSAPIDTLNTAASQLPNISGVGIGIGMPVFQGQSSSTSPGEFEEMMFNNPQRLDGLEFIYGDMVNNRSGSSSTTCGATIDWSEMSSLVYPHLPSNYDDLSFHGAN